MPHAAENPCDALKELDMKAGSMGRRTTTTTNSEHNSIWTDACYNQSRERVDVVCGLLCEYGRQGCALVRIMVGG